MDNFLSRNYSEPNQQKTKQFFSEECGYYSIPQTHSREQPNYINPGYRKHLSNVTNVNERKCPIYVHNFNRPPNSSQYTLPDNLSNRLSRTNPKIMLDRLEESYWAMWKPKNKGSFSSNKNVAHGDTHETMMRTYFNTNDSYHSHSRKSAQVPTKDCQIVYKSNQEIQTETPAPITNDTESITINHVGESSTESESGKEQKQQFITKNDQEIQTEYIFPAEIHDPQQEPRTQSQNIKASKSEADNSKHRGKTRKHTEKRDHGKDERKRKTPKRKQSKAHDILIETIEVPSSETKSMPEMVDKEVKGVEDDIEGNRLLKHKDSFIIHRKKRNQIKEFLQQPRCIKLFRKTTPGFSTGGGSYPLKSCLKKESFGSSKGSFKMGAPGRSLFMSNSYNRHI